MTDTDMPENIVCYSSEGGALLVEKLGEHRYFSKGRVGTQYRLKSTVDAELAELEKEVEYNRKFFCLGEKEQAMNKTIRALADVLENLVVFSEDSDQIARDAEKALSDNKERIAEAQEVK